MEIDLNTPVSKVPFIGTSYAKRLTKLGIEKAGDLIHHYPFRYNDFSLISKINSLQVGETATVRGRIISAESVYSKAGKRFQKAQIADESGILEAVWFNQPYLINNFVKGCIINLSGKLTFFGKKIVMESPEYELLNLKFGLKTIHTGRIVPVYPETFGVSSKWLRNRIFFLLKEGLNEKEKEYLPEEIRKNNNLSALDEALKQIHFPKNFEEIKQAKKRLSFEELFLIKLNSLLRKQEWGREAVGKKFQIANFKMQIAKMVQSLPFSLTSAQSRVLFEIISDLAKDKPMNRLLQGDVGSGKTVVAGIAIYTAFLNGYKSALMAPTEILAFQHFETLQKILKPFGVKIALLTASRKKEVKDTDLYIGTHALIGKKVNIDNLALVVIDEQHRFGVEQRAELIKKGLNPHLLTMTATPIPRSAALALYGELDLSYIDEMPKDRQKVQTWLVSENKRNDAFCWIAKKITEDCGQAFIICPLIEESEKETMRSVKAATAEYLKLKNEFFKDLKLSLLHGKIKSKEKERILDEFKSGKIDILVSTPVVEVGIDNPNAIIMVIEAAERFGLSQLHQLRGRVGRGRKKSYCLLFSQNTSRNAYLRIKTLEKIYNGAKLSEIDLKFRGPGAIFGTLQHGFLKLKIASLNDFELIDKVNKAVQLVLADKNCLNQLLQNKKITLAGKAVAN